MGDVPSGYLTVRHGIDGPFIELYGSPFLIAWVDLSSSQTLSHNQMVNQLYTNYNYN